MLPRCAKPTGVVEHATADELLRHPQVQNLEHGKAIVMVTNDAQAAESAYGTMPPDKGRLEPTEAS